MRAGGFRVVSAVVEIAFEYDGRRHRIDHLFAFFAAGIGDRGHSGTEI